jgi:hypothetical protein
VPTLCLARHRSGSEPLVRAATPHGAQKIAMSSGNHSCGAADPLIGRNVAGDLQPLLCDMKLSTLSQGAGGRAGIEDVSLVAGSASDLVTGS